MRPVLTDRGYAPADVGLFGCQKPVCGGFPGRFDRRLRMTTLCNSPLPADLLNACLHKKEAPLPARVQTNRPCQTRQDLNRSPRKTCSEMNRMPQNPNGRVVRHRSPPNALSRERALLGAGLSAVSIGFHLSALVALAPEYVLLPDSVEAAHELPGVDAQQGQSRRDLGDYLVNPQVSRGDLHNFDIVPR